MVRMSLSPYACLMAAQVVRRTRYAIDGTAGQNGWTPRVAE
jgi:hypothetical protein